MNPATITATSTLRLRHLSSAPRAHLFSCHCRRLSTTRPLRGDSSSSRSSPPSLSSSSSSSSSSSPFSSFGGPAPPRLPKEEQEIFESLQRSSTGAFSTPRAPPRINQSPQLSEAEAVDAQSTVQAKVEKIQTQTAAGRGAGEAESGGLHPKVIEADGKGEELHPNVVRGAEPEFEGDVNPKTGEVGGPKNEPLRWGSAGEWTYNGRTTDF